MGLELAHSGITSALRVVESGNRTVPSQALAVFEESDGAAKLLIREWNQMKANLLPRLNNELKQASQPPLSIDEN
jgi:hypothetical protein